MPPTTPFKRLILRAVLRNLSPMVIRLVSVSDRTNLPGLHDAFHAILGWSGDLGYLVRIHGQEFNSFRRSTRSKALRDCQLHRQEKFLYVCDVMDLWGVFAQLLEKVKVLYAVNTPLSSASSSKALRRSVLFTGKPNFTRQFSWSALHH